MQIKLAEALLRRKELQAKVDQISSIKAQNIYDLRVQRIKITDSVDEVTANVPKLNLSQVTAEYDHYARQLRLVDAAIQQANWTSVIDCEGDVMCPWSEKTS